MSSTFGPVEHMEELQQFGAVFCGLSQSESSKNDARANVERRLGKHGVLDAAGVTAMVWF